MSNAFESIQQGLMEAIEFSEGEKKGATVHKFNSVDVKAVRTNVSMTQIEFASTFGISLGTLRHWERGDRTPRGPALVLLNVLSKDPQAVIRALA
ncbi:NadS family protein [Shewanella saliphila]|uniref:Transcriptional regulator n=1 Tax=Shewanella saliphila TaxID=2282698 RepID=A0ABQ2Q881_9GAMM|nr:NadS family protein [Shewanella saliphila]MCL1102142.1 helix-turn-helix domain-containing protein [Shewanella saliphila]GGP54228.1 transcriptional regulator [Shewanella saliphila]